MSFISKLKKYSSEDCILIYQMGKVGSTSIEHSLKNSIHLHTLYNNSPCHVHQRQREGAFFGKYSHKLMSIVRRAAIRKRKTIKIISLVRDPYQRDISMFFQDLPHWLYEYIGSNKVNTKSENRTFLSEAFNKSYDNKYALTWFDKEIKRFTGIDVLTEGFNKNEGFTIYEKGKYKLLVLDVKKIANCESVISDFSGVDVQLISSNKAENKWYSELYRNFKNEHVFSDLYNYELKKSKFWKVFFGE